ncbi:anthranilate synthase component I [Helicobacter pylori]|nr:anthranilate synthase component I [Helicobacter pylori]
MKALEVKSKACNQPPINGSSFLKRIDNHNIVKSLAQRLIAKRFL